ncbi:MAG: glycosyltransferase [Bacteroidales bacterium]|nr:glycosyltransferase [Bacteroidales bacterium]MDD3989174.1 glycosyltransferase [Bacteroidales bacterium]
MATFITVLRITELLLFVYSLFAVGYLMIFALMALVKTIKAYPPAILFNKIAVIIPAYKEDNVIYDSVSSIKKQDYPVEDYSVIIVSDGMKPETNLRLHSEGIELLVLDKPSGSKANAMAAAVKYLGERKFDIAIVLDADNVVSEGFLKDINDAFCSGARAIQTHRTAKNLNTDIAVLDAISEEINNSIFRKGQVNLGLSSALAGSGMAFDYSWFIEHIPLLKTAGEDKELEIMLLKERIPVRYLDYSPVYDEKTQKVNAFYGQRRRWIAAQFGSLKAGLKELPHAIRSLNIDLINKILQWTILPRVILLGLTGVISVTLSVVQLKLSLKWWIILSVLATALIISVPGNLWNKRSFAAMRRVPLVFLLMFINLFRTKGVNRKYIHTQKGA